MNETAKIKKFYIEPPLTVIENEFEVREGRAKCLWCAFEVKTKIWLDQYLPEYRHAIPEAMEHRKEMLEHWADIKPIEMRFLTYVPTGRVVYDNTLPHAEAVVYEYILQSLRKDLVSK